MNNDCHKYQWSGVFTTVKNGVNINENFTFRMDTEKELMDAREKVLNLHTPSAKSFPDDEGNSAHTATQDEKVCPVHRTPLNWRPAGVSKQTGRPYNGFWACSQKNEDGSFCKEGSKVAGKP